MSLTPQSRRAKYRKYKAYLMEKDGELERGEDLDQFPITFILYDGLLKTFPCE